MRKVVPVRTPDELWCAINLPGPAPARRPRKTSRHRRSDAKRIAGVIPRRKGPAATLPLCVRLPRQMDAFMPVPGHLEGLNSKGCLPSGPLQAGARALGQKIRGFVQAFVLYFMLDTECPR